jgi:glycosyltransferase involved in cell wall biosynthesis
MQIGIDVEHLRHGQAGISSHIRHLLTGLRQLSCAHRFQPFLYGYPGMPEPESVRLLGKSSRAALRYFWDGPSPWLLSNYINGQDSRTARLAGEIDRRLLFPWWRRLSEAHFTWHQRWPPLGRLCRHHPPVTVDLYHHMGLIILPPHHFRMNVMTVFDLTPLLTPEYHVEGAEHLDWFNEAFAMASQMDALIASSQSTKRDIINTLGIPEEKVAVTPLAAHAQYQPLEDPEEVRRLLAKYHLAGQPYLLHVGTLEPRKNVCRLIEAFHSLLLGGSAADHQLVLVGEKGWHWEAIFDTIQSLGLDAKVRWLNYVPFEDLPALYRGADVFVYPSLFEGFGLPPLEAMSCGTPVITSAVTSMPEVVGDAGVLVDPTRVEELAAAMHHLLSDRELRAAYREKSLARARQFSWERTARLTLEVYEQVRRQSQGKNPRRNQRPSSVSKCQAVLRRWVIDQLPGGVG